MNKTMNDNPALILLPGLLCDHALWQHQTSSLGEIFDITVADLTREDNVPDLARAVLARAPQTFALAGLSMGGYVAMEIMRQAPDRVERLALLDTTARADTPEQTERRKTFINMTEVGKFKGVTAALLPNLVHPDFVEDPAIGGVVTQMAERVGKEAFLRQQHAIMNRIDSRPHLKAVKCPTLVLCGSDDALTPVELHEEMAAEIGEVAELAIVKRSGHLAPLEQPQVVNYALQEWMKR